MRRYPNTKIPIEICKNPLKDWHVSLCVTAYSICPFTIDYMQTWTIFNPPLPSFTFSCSWPNTLVTKCFTPHPGPIFVWRHLWMFPKYLGARFKELFFGDCSLTEFCRSNSPCKSRYFIRLPINWSSLPCKSVYPYSTVH